MWFWQNCKGSGYEFARHWSKLSLMCPSMDLHIPNAFFSIKP